MLRPVEAIPTRWIEIMRYIRPVFAANVEEGHQVLILTDTDHDPLVWHAAAAAVHELKAVPTLAIFPRRQADYQDPPEPVVQAMLSSNLNVFLTSTCMFHSPAAHRAMNAGRPSLVMDGGMTADMFTRGAVTADYGQMLELKYRVGKALEGGRKARLTSRHGTDLRFSIEGRIFVPKPFDPSVNPLKVFHRKQEGRTTSPLYGLIYPGLEFNIPPLEEDAEGVAVVDTSIHQFGLLQEPIRFTVRRGKIIEIEGGYQAVFLRRYLEEHGDDHAWYMPAEASIGLNPKARVTGIQREDKTILGSVHVGLGRNDDVGGKIRSRLHLDGVLLRPTLEVDGRTLLRDGNLLV